MATTSRRLLKLLSLLGSRSDWTAAELAERLGVSNRTVRRDIATLRELDYPVGAGRGPAAGYRLGVGTRLPPLVLDEEQAVAVAVALRTAPLSVTGLDETAGGALEVVRQVMPAPLRSEVDALELTMIDNSWEFRAPPVEPTVLRSVGHAVRRRQLLRFDLDGDEPRPVGPPRSVEPHHLALWAGRWYLVAFEPAEGRWVILRVDRLRPRSPSGIAFRPRRLPGDNVAAYVRGHHDRGDTLAPWPCQGSAVLELPADLVGQWAPGGAVVEELGERRSRLHVGAWSWAGVVGLLATFATALHEVEPAELRAACKRVAAAITAGDNSGESYHP